MKKALVTSGLILSAAISPISPFTTDLWAQSEQTIVVSEYNGKEQKTPLNGVSVSVLNAVASITDAQGKATLRFRTLHAGDRVTIRRIEKNGYEIFNSQAIEQWNISPQRPFQIVLCQTERFRALRDQYSRVASDSYAKQYRAEQARLANERKKTKMLEDVDQQKLLDLENQYQQQLEDLEKYVDQFARIDLSELDNQQQELINLVKNGQIEKAIARYESDDYQGQYKKQCEEIARIDKAQAQLAVIEAKKRNDREKILQTINRQIATYRLAGGRENFNKITTLLKSVADADTTQLEAVFNYAQHALMQHQYEECERYFNIYLNACANRPDLQASAWSWLGQGYMLQHNLEEAEKAYSKATAIREEMAKREPDRFIAPLLEIQSIMSNYYLWTGKIEEASKLLSNAIVSCEKMYKEEPQFYWEKLSYLYSDLSITQYYHGDSVLAFSTVQRAYTLAKQNFDSTQVFPPLYNALDKMGQLYYMSGNWEKLAETGRIQTEVGELLYKQNPQGQINYLQAYYNNLAEAYLQLKDFTACEKALIRSEELLKEIEEKHSVAYSRFELSDIGARLYAALGQEEKKQEYIKAAKNAFSQMPTAEQEQNQSLMDGINKL